MPTAKETTAKKTTRKPSTKKAAPVVTETPVEVIPEVEDVIKEQPVKSPREYAKDDDIPCRSVNAGYMCFDGPRTHQPYPFGNSGDINYIEYQDLNSLLVTHSKILYEPFIVIEDEELLADDRWAELRALYDEIYGLDSARTVLNLPVNEFKERFPKLPLGLKNSIKSEVVRLIDLGQFDSIQKIKTIDEVCGTSIGALMVAD